MFFLSISFIMLSAFLLALFFFFFRKRSLWVAGSYAVYILDFRMRYTCTKSHFLFNAHVRVIFSLCALYILFFLLLLSFRIFFHSVFFFSFTDFVRSFHFSGCCYNLLWWTLRRATNCKYYVYFDAMRHRTLCVCVSTCSGLNWKSFAMSQTLYHW